MLTEHKVTTLRDVGCNTAMVRKSLVLRDSFTGENKPVVLLDRTARDLPEVENFIRLPYFTRNTVS